MSSKLSFWAIVVIAANTMNGPGLTTLPSIANSAGRLPYCGLVALAALATSFVLKRLCDLLWRTNRNGNNQKSPKHTSLHHHHHHHHPDTSNMDLVALSDCIFRQRKVAAVTMVGCALSLALAQMMLCAAIADSMLVASFGQSCGMAPFASLHMRTYCTNTLSMKPFLINNIPTSLLSAGLAISATITISLASVDLDSMLTAQYMLFGCLLVACARFSWTLHQMSDSYVFSVDHGGNKHNNFFGPSPFDAIGPVLFNFAFVVTAPPLSSGADSCQGATKALITSVVIMGALYSIVGGIGATAAHNSAKEDDNLLSLVLRGTDTNQLDGMDVLAVVSFGLSQLAAIPVYCELARETLQVHLQMRNRQLAFFVSHVLPWGLVALTYNSTLFEAFVEWSSLLLLGFANFSLPLLLDHHALASESKLHTPGSGPDAVLWGLCVITASIAGVIVQRMTDSMFLAEGTFMLTTLLILKYEREPIAMDTKSSTYDVEGQPLTAVVAL